MGENQNTAEERVKTLQATWEEHAGELKRLNREPVGPSIAKSVYRDLDKLRVRIRDLEERTPHQDRASAPTAPALGNDNTS